MISVEGLTKRYGDFTAVAGSDFEVARGEVVVFPAPLGPTTPKTSPRATSKSLPATAISDRKSVV